MSFLSNTSIYEDYIFYIYSSGVIVRGVIVLQP